MLNNPVPKIVQRELSKFLNKVFFFSPSSNYAEELVWAATGHTYVETAEGKADNLHLKIRACGWENILQDYQEITKPYVRRLNLRTAILAFDITSEPFYGKTCGLYTIGCKNENGYNHEFQFLVLSLADEEKEAKIPLASIPIHLGFDVAQAVKDLLAFASKLVKIRFVLFDRGFYSVDMMKVLEHSRCRYIMLIPERSDELKYLSESVIDAGYAHYRMKSGLGEEFFIRVVAVRDYSDKFTWLFATNMIFEDYYAYVRFYKKRWRIETGFRVEDEAGIKSKSVFFIVRYFYFTISLLLHAIWLAYRRETPFKRFLIQMSKYLMLEGLNIPQLSTH